LRGFPKIILKKKNLRGGRQSPSRLGGSDQIGSGRRVTDLPRTKKVIALSVKGGPRERCIVKTQREGPRSEERLTTSTWAEGSMRRKKGTGAVRVGWGRKEKALWAVASVLEERG